MLKKYSALLFPLCIVLFAATAMMPKEEVTHVQSLADTISVNVFKLRFKKENGRFVDFRMGESLAFLSPITISVNEPYTLTQVSVILVRGKRPVTAKTYSGKQEVIIEKEFFANAQAGDRLNIDLASVTIQKNGETIPLVLDVPVFNIPLNE